jgi:alanine racemase
LTTLRQNFRTVQKHVGPKVTVCAVVKADAYGHGAIECSRALEAEGAKWLGVIAGRGDSAARGWRWREHSFDDWFLAGEEARLCAYISRPRSGSLGISKLWMLRLPRWVWRSIRCLESGYGHGTTQVAVDQLPGVLKSLKAAKHLRLEGLSTHLASSEIMDAPSVAEQERRFDLARRMVSEAGMEPTFVHMANTAAVISRRETWNSMVRPGVALYGYYLPFQRAGREVSGGTLRLPVKAILTWKTRILSLRDFGANQALGYGATYVTKAPAHVAVLPVGYADGYNRQLSNRGRVIVREDLSIGPDLDGSDAGGVTGFRVLQWEMKLSCSVPVKG